MECSTVPACEPQSLLGNRVCLGLPLFVSTFVGGAQLYGVHEASLRICSPVAVNFINPHRKASTSRNLTSLKKETF